MADSANHDARHLTVESLNTLSTRLFDHADHITKAAAGHIADDLRATARVTAAHAALRIGVTTAATAIEEAAARLRELLAAEA
jgi:hypothetical protein